MKFLTVVVENREVLINITNITKICSGGNNTAVIVVRRAEQDEVLMCNTAYTEIKKQLMDICNQSYR